MSGTPFHVVWLTAIWLALWGNISVANVVSGVIVGLMVTAISRVPRPVAVRIRPLALARYVGFMIVQISVSAAVVAREIATPGSKICTGTVAVPLPDASDAVITFVADSLSLPPGTFAVEVSEHPRTLYVHVLHFHDVAAVHRLVRRLEVLAVKAIGSPADIAALAVDDTELAGPT